MLSSREITLSSRAKRGTLVFYVASTRVALAETKIPRFARDDIDSGRPGLGKTWARDDMDSGRPGLGMTWNRTGQRRRSARAPKKTGNPQPVRLPRGRAAIASSPKHDAYPGRHHAADMPISDYADAACVDCSPAPAESGGSGDHIDSCKAALECTWITSTIAFHSR